MEKIEKIIEIIKNEVDEDYKDIEITDETDLRDDLQLSSLNMLVICSAVEDEFGVEMNFEKLRRIKTIQDIKSEIYGLSVSKQEQV